MHIKGTALQEITLFQCNKELILMNQLPFQCNIWLIFTMCKSTSLFQSTENSSWTIFHLQVVDYRVFMMVIICLFCCCRELNLHNSTYMVNLVLFSRNFVLHVNWKTHLVFLSQLSWNSNNDIALPCLTMSTKQ